MEHGALPSALPGVGDRKPAFARVDRVDLSEPDRREVPRGDPLHPVERRVPHRATCEVAEERGFVRADRDGEWFLGPEVSFDAGHEPTS